MDGTKKVPLAITFLAWGVILAVAVAAAIGGARRIGGVKEVREIGNPPQVTLPSIIGGDLVLPAAASNAGAAGTNFSKTITAARLSVVSVNLTAVFDKDNKMTGIRLLGEAGNPGDKIAAGVSPVVKLYDKDGKLTGQKIAQPSTGWDFIPIPTGEVYPFDYLVDSPPVSERLELSFNVTASTESAALLPLKIAGRAVETKQATVSGQTATDAAQNSQQFEYYTIAGKIVNTYQDAVSDIIIYAWAKNRESKVIAFGRADFKNDLLAAGDKIDFRIILLPIQANQKMITYEVAAWGKEYKINL